MQARKPGVDRFGRFGAVASSVVAIGAVLALSACSSSSGGGGGATSSGASGSSSSGARPNVVASTDVWGDIATQVGGDDVTVTSIITDPSQDPHSYEADPRVQLSLSRANLVIENGGGYDDFVDRLLKSSGKNPTLINAVKVSGKTAPAGGELNEHVWYDMPTVDRMADTIAQDLGRLDSAHASTFTANATAFKTKVAGIETKEAAVKAKHAGAGAAITEPVPLYMLTACGLVNRTPAKFSEAIEEGDDVSVGILNTTLELFSQHKVELLAYNEQTSGPETEKVLDAAKSAKVPVVPVTETLPSGKNFITWMTGNVDAIGSALDQK